MEQRRYFNNLYLQSRYDKIAPDWNGRAYEGTRRDDIIPQLIELSRMESSPGLVVLEAMAGTGNLTRELASFFPECGYTCLDFSKGMLEQIPNGICERICASVLSMPFAPRRYDRIFLRSALYDLPELRQYDAVKEVARVLKEDGLFVLQTYVAGENSQPWLNELVNRKDSFSGFRPPPGDEVSDASKETFPRFFPTESELSHMIARASLREVNSGFCFLGRMRYLLTNELEGRGRSDWLDYARSIPPSIQHELQFRETDAGLEFNFPGIVRVYRKIPRG